MSEGEIQVKIDDYDGADVTLRSRPREDSSEEMRRQAEASVSEAARLRQESANMQRVAARERVAADMARAELEAQTAERTFAEAIERGDFSEAAAATKQMTLAETRRLRLDEQDHALQHAPLPAADPVEAFIATRTEPTARWLRDHRDWVTDPEKNAELTAAHHNAMRSGFKVDTREYFEHVERRVGLDSSGNRRSGGRRPPVDYNPNDVNTHILRGGAEVVLTKGERQTATDGTHVWNYGPNRGKPIGIAEMARRKVQMVREGRYQKLD